jgi:hypothetical protein
VLGEGVLLVWHLATLFSSPLTVQLELGDELSGPGLIELGDALSIFLVAKDIEDGPEAVIMKRLHVRKPLLGELDDKDTESRAPSGFPDTRPRDAPPSMATLGSALSREPAANHVVAAAGDRFESFDRNRSSRCRSRILLARCRGRFHLGFREVGSGGREGRLVQEGCPSTHDFTGHSTAGNLMGVLIRVIADEVRQRSAIHNPLFVKQSR